MNSTQEFMEELDRIKMEIDEVEYELQDAATEERKAELKEELAWLKNDLISVREAYQDWKYCRGDYNRLNGMRMSDFY